MAEIVHVDGSVGEGGGQVVRTALSLSAITGQTVSIEHIRAGRQDPGLRAQHLTAVRAAADVCGAEVKGAELGSRELTFQPGTPPQPGPYSWEVGTAGAVSLVFQTVLWPLAFADGRSSITLAGGTHVAWSPPVDYVQQVYLPVLAGLGLEASVEIERWGWYPRGGGVVRATIAGQTRLRNLTATERGSLRDVWVRSAASNLPEHIRQRQAQRADFLLRKQGIKPQLEILSPPSPGQGTVVFVLADYRYARAGFTAYGRIRKPAEKVAEEACKAFVRYHKRHRPVDAHLADQLLLPLSFATGSSQYATESVTQHLLTNAWVIQKFLDVHIEIEGDKGQPGTVTITTRR